MKAELERSFKTLPAPTTSASLTAAVLLRIAHARERAARVRAGMFGFATVLSLCALVPAVRFILSEAARSPFLSYLSLIVSDFGGALSAWRELFFALAESAPWGGIAATTALVLVFLISLRAALRQLPASFSGPAGMAAR